MTSSEFQNILLAAIESNKKQNVPYNQIKKILSKLGIGKNSTLGSSILKYIDKKIGLRLEFLLNLITRAMNLEADIIKSYLTKHNISSSEYQNLMAGAYATTEINDQLPITQYFISSSHNTYLEGDQLAGKSTVEMYQKVLSAGCRCVELDCWDGEVDGKAEPIIYHGYTLTSKILFRDVVKTIKEYAFKNNPYPVILSLENHCSIKCQIIMAKYFVEYFGDNLLLPSDIKNLNETILSKLKNKIILKGKVVAKHYKERTTTSKLYPSAKTEKTLLERKKELDTKTSTSVPKANIADNLSNITFLNTVHALDTLYNDARPHFEMTSIDEDKIIVYAGGEQLKKQDVITKYSASNFIRIYPKNIRVDSSNYNPITSWNLGCQIVALNWQTSGTYMWTNTGMFDAYSHGYRPRSTVTKTEKDITTISVFSGKYISTKSVTTYLRVTCIATLEKTYKTKIDKENGLCPIWKARFDFNLTKLNPNNGLVFILFEVVDELSDVVLAHKSVLLSDIRKGYHHLDLVSDLKDNKFQTNPSVFVRVL